MFVKGKVLNKLYRAFHTHHPIDPLESHVTDSDAEAEEREVPSARPGTDGRAST